MAEKKDLIVFAGGIFRDLVATTPKFPSPGETIMGTDFFTGFGGKCSNQAVMCTLLGGRAAMVGKLGDDDHGKAYLENFNSVGVNIDHLGIEPGCSSGIASIFVNTSTGENQIIIVPGANARVTPEDIQRADPVFTRASAVVCALEMNLSAIEAALKKGRACGATTILNAAPARTDLPDGMLHNVDILCVNEGELQLLSGGMSVDTPDQIDRACAHLLRRFPTVIVTLGGAGAVIAQREQSIVRVPTDKVDQVVDTTGAGDAFVGSLAYFLQNGKELDFAEIVRRACCIASMTVMKEGTQASYPKREEVKKELLLLL